MQRAQDMIGDGMSTAVTGEIPLVDMLPQTQAKIVEIMRDMGLNAEEAR